MKWRAQSTINGQALALKAWVAALELETSGAAQRSRYVFFASATFGTLCLTRLAIAKGSLRGSRQVHDRVVAAVLAAPLAWFEATPAGRVLNRAAQESEIPNFKGSDLGHFPLVSADFWTSDHLSERSRSVDVFFVTRARGTLTLKRR
jgi:hypothetical protein